MLPFTVLFINENLMYKHEIALTISLVDTLDCMLSVPRKTSCCFIFTDKCSCYLSLLHVHQNSLLLPTAFVFEYNFQDDTAFEKQSALFALAVSDIVLINM